MARNNRFSRYFQCKKKLELIFPVRSNLFIHPGRVFGHIGKKIHIKIILNPDAYLQIFIFNIPGIMKEDIKN